MFRSSWLSLAILGGIASCCGDTFASEFGSVMGFHKPRLITTFRTVPPGNLYKIKILSNQIYLNLICKVVYFIIFLS